MACEKKYSTEELDRSFDTGFWTGMFLGTVSIVIILGLLHWFGISFYK